MPDDTLTPITVVPATVQDIYDKQGKLLNFGLRMSKAIRVGKDKSGEVKFNFWRGQAGDSKQTQFPLPDYDKMDLNLPFLKLRTKNIARSYPTHSSTLMELSSRLVIGMGHASVYETGLTLHPVYGIPYLPASSLKGVVRRRYIEDNYGDNEVAALADRLFCDLFGRTGLTRIETGSGFVDARSHYRTDVDSGDRRGALIFLDAFPVAAPTIEEDIVNPHYKPYYEDALPPADIYNPVPINFLTIAPGVQFEVALALDTYRTPSLSADDFTKVTATLIATLTEDGIGGKTTVGYGRLVDVMAERERVALLDQKRLAEQQRREKERKGITTATAEDYVSLADLKQKRGAYRVSVKVVGANPNSRYVFEPLVEELRGKRSQPIFVHLDLSVGDRIDGVEISGVNVKSGKFTINQNTLRK